MASGYVPKFIILVSFEFEKCIVVLFQIVRSWHCRVTVLYKPLFTYNILSSNLFSSKKAAADRLRDRRDRKNAAGIVDIAANVIPC